MAAKTPKSDSPHADQSVACLIARIREQGDVTGEDIAAVTGVKLRQVQNWAAGRARPSRGRLRLLLDLAYVVEELSNLYEPEGVVLWLQGRNQMLDGERPIDLIQHERTDDILVVLGQITEGPNDNDIG